MTVSNKYLMVDVAQLVEHWIVVPVAAGSSPVIHPNFKRSWCNLVAAPVSETGGSNPMEVRILSTAINI